jgi:hypothetical protein
MTNAKADVLFHADLADREFGSALLSVEKLTAWAQDKDLELMTLPSLTGYRFVQAEALLCAIERGVNNLTPEQAVAIVKADPVLSKHRAVTEPSGYVDPTTCRWLLGADAHVSWRRLLESAIEKKELTLLNFASKLPINDEPGQRAAPDPAAVVKASEIEPSQWKMKIQIEAAARMVRLRAANANPTVHSIINDMARWCKDNEVKTDGGIFPSASYIRTHVLGGKNWTPPR